MAAETPYQQNNQTSSDAFAIDYKRIGYNALRYWYLILFCLGIGIFGAYLNNRYATSIYSLYTSLIILEKGELSGSEILYQSSLSDPYRNYLNEPYILRSRPIVEQVIRKLNFDVAFYRKGAIKLTEEFGLPIRVRLLKPNGSYGKSIVLNVLDQDSYSLSDVEKSGKAPTLVFHFGDSIFFLGHHLMVDRDSLANIGSILGSEYVVKFLNPASVAGSYSGKLGISWAEKGAGVLNISTTGANVRKELAFLNELIAAYQENDLRKKNQVADRTISFVDNQLKLIADSLHSFDGRLLNFQLNNPNVAVSFSSKVGNAQVGNSGNFLDQLTQIDNEKTGLLIREKYFDYLLSYLKEGRNLDLVIMPSSIGLPEAGDLAIYLKEMIQTQLEIKPLIEKGLDKNPLVQKGVNVIEEIKVKLNEAVRVVRITDKLKMDILKRKSEEVEKKMRMLPVEQQQYISLQRGHSLLENQYLFLMQKKSEAEIARASTSSDIIVVNPPMAGGAIAPKTSQNYSIGAFLGLLFPALVLVALELFNNKVQSKDDLDKILNIPFIGGIGHSDLKENLVVNLRPKSSVAESFRSIRSNLNYFTSGEQKKTFLITSSISGEGKTFTSVNLATVFAMSGKRTLIIGADMRKPKIFSDFNLSNHVGLSGYLSNINSFEEVIQATSVQNLDLISGGPVPPNPSELLLTPRFEMLMQTAFSIYDYVILDTPPVALVSDAFLLSKYVDHTIFVVRQNYTPKGFLKDLKESLATGKLKNASVLLNDIYKSGLGYGYGYGHSYGYGYGYGRKKNGGGYYED
jgi:capsular exopolysaccharide synthesis family protein